MIDKIYCVQYTKYAVGVSSLDDKISIKRWEGSNFIQGVTEGGCLNTV